MCAPSVPEAVDTIAEAAPAAPEGSLVTVIFATAGEAPPAPAGSKPEVVLLMDPQWGDRGLVQWTVGQSVYLALSAPYCFNDPQSVDAMRILPRSRSIKGYTKVAFVQSATVCLSLPTEVPGLCHARQRTHSWEMVPGHLNRLGSEETPASYGG